MIFSRLTTLAIPVIAILLGTQGIAPAQQLAVNGGFEATTNGANRQFDFNTTAVGWTSTNANQNAYNFIYSAGAADTSGANGQFGLVKLWGPGTGSNNGLPASSPDGNNFVAADSVFQNGAISQTIVGLIPGEAYRVGFWWAGAQQSGFDGPSTGQWQVTFGAQTQSTNVVNTPSHGFTGWTHQEFDYVANNTSQILSFFAVGTPIGVPAFVLLDGVTVNAVPEPTTLSMIGFGIVGSGVYLLRRRATLAKALSEDLPVR